MERRLRSAGCHVGITRDPTLHDRISAALTVTTTTGQHLTVDLSVPDLINLVADIGVLLKADQAQIDIWWERLATGADGRPRAAKRSA